jgi:hypothetical protein
LVEVSLPDLLVPSIAHKVKLRAKFWPSGIDSDVVPYSPSNLAEATPENKQALALSYKHLEGCRLPDIQAFALEVKRFGARFGVRPLFLNRCMLDGLITTCFSRLQISSGFIVQRFR